MLPDLHSATGRGKCPESATPGPRKVGPTAFEIDVTYIKQLIALQNSSCLFGILNDN